MQLQTGNYVIYRSTEICRIDGFEKKSFDGVTEREYCILIPEGAQHSKYYVPTECADTKLRCLLTKDEINELIKGMSEEQPDWGDTDERRKDRFNTVLNSGDYRMIISMMHSLYLQRQERIANGKKMLAADEKALKAAEQMINREFSFVLGIQEKDVESYITQHLNNG